MLARQTATFIDPEQFRGAISGADVDYKVIAPGEFRASLTVIDAGSVLVQRAHERLRRITCIALMADSVSLSGWFGSAPVIRGRRMSPGEFMLCTSGADCIRCAEPGNDAFSLQMSRAHLDDAAVALTGRPTGVTAAQVVRPPPPLTNRLLSLIHCATSAAPLPSDISPCREAVDAFAEAMTRALVACLTAGHSERPSTSINHRARIVGRFVDAVEASIDQPLYMVDLCKAVGVSGRALRAYCQEHLGMSPHRFLWLRRMNLAHRALLHASPETTTVTDVATSFGFWELGRFAVAYKALFGESPSATLHSSVQAKAG